MTSSPKPSADYLAGRSLSSKQERLIEFAGMLEAIHRQIPRILELHISPHNLSLLAWEALKGVGELGDRATLTAIGERIGVSASTMTGIAARLEQAGYVERTVSRVDRRASILTLTPRGHNVVASIVDALLGTLSRMAEDIDPAGLDRLVADFRRILHVVEQFDAPQPVDPRVPKRSLP
jgi:DNA-binding MarR family transcriptional regulator